jgi:hypothetical protein
MLMRFRKYSMGEYAEFIRNYLISSVVEKIARNVGHACCGAQIGAPVAVSETLPGATAIKAPCSALVELAETCLTLVAGLNASLQLRLPPRFTENSCPLERRTVALLYAFVMVMRAGAAGAEGAGC